MTLVPVRLWIIYNVVSIVLWVKMGRKEGGPGNCRFPGYLWTYEGGWGLLREGCSLNEIRVTVWRILYHGRGVLSLLTYFLPCSLSILSLMVA